MSLRRAQQEIDSREFNDWMAYMELEPFGPLRAADHAGTIAAVVANVNRDPSRRPEPFLAADFFDELADPTARPTAQLPSNELLEAKLMGTFTRIQQVQADAKAGRTILTPRHGSPRPR